MVHMKIIKKCGGELEHALRSRCIEPCSTKYYINSLDKIVTRTKIGRTWKEFDIKSSNKPFIKKDKPRETLKTNTSNSNEQRKCHNCGGVGKLANNCLKKEKINEIIETEDNNDKEEEYDSEKDTEESETSVSNEINIINAQINDIDLIYEVLDVNSNLPQAGASDTSLKNIQDAKLYKTKPAKGMGYTAGKPSISILMVENQEEKLKLDTGEYCTCSGKSYLKTILPDWEEKLIPIQGVKFISASESMKPLVIINLTLIFDHPSQCIRLKVQFLVMDNCTRNQFKLGNDYLSIYGIDVFNQKDRYFTIGDNKRQTFSFFNNKTKLHLNAFATDKEPLGAIIGHEVNIILNAGKPYPPLSRRPAYPASPRAREALEAHIKESIGLGVLRKVGHNEQVEVTTPIIITWNNGK
ncbi:hypothetical protein O181_082526 [Austropuccinia psidii MF-1]|uniref:Uncharacterized protein n=1 Tax=Austropuccinia psidii MF-1 TaxID=1389203 RepID=A0A9Q3FSS5_9BASI|nr:hypothetical protein [Austropuccinia psidii MF-1]